MLNISSALLLFLIEAVFVSSAAALFLFFQNRKLRSARNGPQGPGKDAWKDKFETLTQAFQRVKEINSTLAELLGPLIPETPESEDIRRLLTDMDRGNEDIHDRLKKFHAVIQAEIASHKEESEARKQEIAQLTGKLNASVKKEEYDRIETERNRFKIRAAQLEKQLKEKKEESEKIEKERAWLENEYTLLYENLDDEHKKKLEKFAPEQPDLSDIIPD